jgi:hypothetical protein
MKPAIFLFFLVPNLIALDITTLDGKTYRDCRVSRVDPDGICVLWSGSGARIKFTNLPEAVRAQYGYEPDKAATFERAEAARQERERIFVETQRSQSQARSAAAGSGQPPNSQLPGFGNGNTGSSYVGVNLAAAGSAANLNGQSLNQFGGGSRRTGAQYVGVNVAGPGGAIYGIGYGPVRQLRP